jgi:hypothetical protein
MMTKQTRALSFLTLAIAGAALGCGEPQADDGYLGEPLLTVQGSIRTTGSTTISGDVVPAVAWLIGTDEAYVYEHALIQETAVRGEFPTHFTMDVVSPPPAKVPKTLVIKGLESEPLVQVATLIALPKKHDPEVVLGYGDDPVEESCVKNAAGETECTSKYCDYYGECFTERCNWETDECTLVEGRPQTQAGLGIAAGFVVDYRVIYLDRPAKRGSITAYHYGVEELSAGYHLVKEVEVNDLTMEDSICLGAADTQGDKDFGAAYGFEPGSEEWMDHPELEIDSFAETYYRDAAARRAGCRHVVEDLIVDGTDDLVMTLGASRTSE